jgi:hypothetical protein
MLYISAVGQYNGLVTLPRIADMYETLGRFIKDLGLLNQVGHLVTLVLARQKFGNVCERCAKVYCCALLAHAFTHKLNSPCNF